MSLSKKTLMLLSGAMASFAAMGATTGASAQECFIGEVRMFAGNFAPRSWAFADGQLMAISQNTALFSILGTTYGGDGRTTFALPDLRGRAAVHPGHGPGLTDRRLGEKFGSETNTLTANQLPSHTHTATTTSTLKATTASGNTNIPTGNVLSDDGNDRIYAAGPADTNMGQSAVTSETTVNPAGGGLPVNNVQPSLGLNHIICLQGIFPSRS